jgi:AraC family transcriptional regulator of adaptative response/methylated-DNA-[protein]-cysteine methyltransferase
MRIRYTTAPTAVGRLLVAATERGICAVKLADVDAELVEGLRREYPEAEIRRAPGGLRHFVDAVVRQINGSDQQAVPLDPPGSLFQWKVWKALLEIPRGTTRSYAQIAADIGAPSATRAVARACAQNRVAVLIPCHRVVRSDGNLGGYRWGTERKRRLLDAERRDEATAGE